MQLADTIRNTFVPIHRQGYPFIAAFAVVTLFLGYFSSILFWIGLILTAWCAYFFRDPVRVTPTDDRLVISPADGVVSAVGPGIPPRVVEQIFSAFFSTSDHGTGLGLYIARQLCEANQSSLTYEPVPGGGSCFRVLLPAAQVLVEGLQRD